MDIQAWIVQQRPNILEGLKTFLRYPTISAQTAYYPALHECANWLQEYLHILFDFLFPFFFEGFLRVATLLLLLGMKSAAYQTQPK